MSSKDATQQAVLVAAASCTGCYTSKRCVFGCFAGILFPFFHLLLELLRLFLVDKSQSSQAVLQFEAVEESTVLVVAPRIEYLLIPYDASHRWLQQRMVSDLRALRHLRRP